MGIQIQGLCLSVMLAWYCSLVVCGYVWVLFLFLVKERRKMSVCHAVWEITFKYTYCSSICAGLPSVRCNHLALTLTKHLNINVSFYCQWSRCKRNDSFVKDNMSLNRIFEH